MPDENNHSFNTGFACRPLDAERAHSALYKLLRLSPPDTRYGEALQYLVQSHALQPKQDAAAISQWSYAQLAQITRNWLYPNNSQAFEIDECLTALWVLEEFQQCQAIPWLYAISNRLITNTALHQAAPHTASGLPSTPGEINTLTLHQWLKRTGIVFSPTNNSTPLGETLDEAAQTALLSVYHQHPFPWSALLEAVAAASSIACHPSVQRLQTHYQALLKSPPASWQRLSWPQRVEYLQTLINPAVDLPATYSETIETLPMLKATRCRPIRCVLLVEGTSEVVLLPAVAHALGCPLAHHKIQLVAVGGKSLMLKAYHQLAGFISPPIIAVLDADGATEQRHLAEAMGNSNTRDSALILPEGTLEDALSDALIAETLNQYYDPPEPLTTADMAARRCAGKHGNQTITALETLFNDWELASPRKGSHKGKQFNKVDFAYHVAQTLLASPPTTCEQWVSSSLAGLIHQAVALAQQDALPLPQQGAE
ncbi:MAG: ATP-dependent endonuclease [Vampirovibrionales bacterium]|nr:ATP-dependent endonuclease [Vampirovibrionales bacterium]